MNEQAPQEERVELRPGLVMVKRRVLKEDGRYLYYFDFERPSDERESGKPSAAA